MKKDIKDLWVKALRSGKYKQSLIDLNNNDGFCCLGVLCDISGLGKWEETDQYKTYFGEQAGLPNEVKEWSGVKENLGQYKMNNSLSFLNDNGTSFNEIADLIEKDWELI